MILAAWRDTPYNIVLFLHIITVIIGLAPAVIHPLLGNQAKDDDAAPKQALYARMAQNGQKIFANSLIVAGLLGFALVGMSDDFWSMGDAWVIISILLWIALIGVMHGALLPSERAVAEGDFSAEARVQKFGAIATLIVVVMLYLMVFTPGAP